MDLKVNDYVTRLSHQHDMVFQIINITEDGNYILKGVNIRLIADSPKEDLVLYEELEETEEEREFLNRVKPEFHLNRNDYFYIPGKILHIDADPDYLKRCLDYYKDASLQVVGVHMREDEVPNQIKTLLEETNPSIVIITGHDAYYKRKGNKHEIDSYKNSKYFVEAVKEARKYEKSHDKLVIIAGACQSDYEDLIQAGANFASSPKRVNIHTLDPAIIATRVSLTESCEEIDLKGILDKTKYGSSGLGGIKTKGMMYLGYPR